MKLELKENMYVRTKDGIIDKVIIDYNGHCANHNCKHKHISCAKNYYDEDKIVKASYNIIDILEVGDYVNGWKVLYWTDGTKIVDDGYATNLDKIDIKSIVTHEQMEQMAYKVGD